MSYMQEVYKAKAKASLQCYPALIAQKSSLITGGPDSEGKKIIRICMGISMTN